MRLGRNHVSHILAMVEKAQPGLQVWGELLDRRIDLIGEARLTGEPNGPESVKVTGPMRSHHSDVVRNWALDGLGIVLLSSWDVASELRRGALQRVLPGYSEAANVWAVTAARTSDSPKIKVCTEFLQKHPTHGKFALDTSIE